jgi:acetyl-CoA carboxylase biotin carboxyl carrier protein
MGLTDDDIREILRIVDESDVAELELETESFSLYVRRGSAPGTAPSRSVQRPRTVREDASPSAWADGAHAQGAVEDGAVVVPSPMLGTFYRAESPGAAPFIEVGSTVGPDTIVGIIEVMKMMNSVPAGMAGTVVEVCAGNGELVEYGEPLLRVAPDAPA